MSRLLEANEGEPSRSASPEATAKRPRWAQDDDDFETEPILPPSTKRPRFFLQGAPAPPHGARQLTLLFGWAVDAAKEIEEFTYSIDCPAGGPRFTRRLDVLKKLYDLQDATVEGMINYAHKMSE